MLFVALIALASAGRPAPVQGATAAERRLDAAVDSALADGRVTDAVAAADSLVARRERAQRAKPLALASWLDSLGLRFFSAGSPEALVAAEPYFARGLALREKALGPDAIEVARSHGTLATLNDYLGRWDEALTHERRALEIRLAKLGPNHSRVADSRRQIGAFLYYLGRFDEAEAELARALAIHRAGSPPDLMKIADDLNNLGEVQRQLDRVGDAEAAFREGLDLVRSREGDEGLEAALTNNLAGLYKDEARYAEAEPLLERALAMRENTEDLDREELARARLNLAEVMRLQGRALEAEPVYIAALEAARGALGTDNPNLLPFLNQTAVVEAELGRPERAEPLYRETLAITERLLGPDHPLVAQTLHDLGGLLAAQGNVAAAESLYAHALGIREERLGPAHPDAAVTRIELARCRFARGDEAGGASMLERAIAVLDSTRTYPESRLDAYALRADRNARAGRRPAAIRDLDVALAGVDELRATRGGGDETRAGFLARRAVLYERMIALRLEGGDLPGALATHERARARVLLDQVAASGVDLRAGIPPDVLAPLVTAEDAAAARLAGAQRRIDAARADGSLTPRLRLVAVAALESSRDSAARDLARARARIEDASPLWREILSADGATLGAGELRRNLPVDAILLVYHVADEGSYLFTVPSSGRIDGWPLAVDAQAAAALGVPKGPLRAATLERIVTGARGPGWPDSTLGIAELLGGTAAGGFVSLQQRSSDGPDSLEIRLHALWRALMPPPAWGRLKRARVAQLVPDGALHLVPFEALVTRPRGRVTRNWLDDGPALAYGASATSLARLAARAAPPATAGAPVLSVSDVAFDPRWPRLPGTARETEAIRAAFPTGAVETISGGAAREPAVRAALAGRRYVHLATHGFVGGSGALLAGLALSPPDSITRGDDDGMLQLYEIYGLPLGCDLAVLSACETARGRRVAGEGAFALSRGFLAAGARRVVATQWVVGDEPAARLVGSLFSKLAAGDFDGFRTALALRDAKREVKRDPRWADPFYWSPFVLSGW